MVAWIVFDLDRHPKEDGSYGRSEEVAFEDAKTLYYGLVASGLKPVLERSCPHGSCKVWLFLDSPISAATAREFGEWFTRGFNHPIEIFPKQETLQHTDRATGETTRGFGNWVRFPGRHHKYREYWSRLWDSGTGDWAKPDRTVDIWISRRSSPSSELTELAQRAAPPQEGPKVVSALPNQACSRGSTDPESLRHRIDPYLEAVCGATRGLGPGSGRADTLYRVGAKLGVDWALPDDFVLESLHAVNHGFGTPYPEAKLRDTLANAHRYGKGAYGNDLNAPKAVPPTPVAVAAGGLTTPPNQLVPSFIRVTDLLRKELPKVPTILGGERYPNLWRRGTNLQIHGPEGVGKTQAAIWLTVSLAGALPWFEIPGPEKPLIVAMVATELDEELLQIRINQALRFLGKDEDACAEIASRIFVLPSNLWIPSSSTVSTLDRFHAEMDSLCARLMEVGAQVGIFDPLLSFWSEKLNYAPLVDLALRLPQIIPGFSPGWIQHNRKTGADQQSGSNEALANSIGDGDWTRRGIRTAFQLAPYGKSNTIRELSVTKCNHSHPPPPFYLKHNPDFGGLLEVCPKPETAIEVAETNRDRLLDLVRRRPGVTVKEAADELELSEKQARDGLSRLLTDHACYMAPQPLKKNRGQIPNGYWLGSGEDYL